VLTKRNALFVSKLSATMQDPDLETHIALVESMVEQGYDVTEIAAAAIRMARADDLRRPILDVREPNLRRESDRPTNSRDRFGRGSSSTDRRFDRRDHDTSSNGGGDRAARPPRFGGESDGESRRPRVDKTGREAGMVRLKVDAGREHGVGPGDVVGAIAGRAGIPGKAIGAIDIHSKETYVDVQEMHVERVLSELKNGAMLRGKEITVQRADSN